MFDTTANGRDIGDGGGDRGGVDDDGGGVGSRDDDDGDGGGVDMRGLLIPVESLTNPHHYLLTNKILNIYLLTKLTLSAIREKAKSPQIAQEICFPHIPPHHRQL